MDPLGKKEGLFVNLGGFFVFCFLFYPKWTTHWKVTLFMRLSVKYKSFESPVGVQCARASCPSYLQTPEGPGSSSVSSWPFSCQFWRSLTQPPDVSRKSYSCSLVHCSFPLGSEGWQTFAGRSAKPVSKMMLLHLHLSENHNEGLSKGHSQLTAASILLYTELWLRHCPVS